MVDRTQSQGFWGAAKRSVNPPVIRDNKATIDITHIGVRLQWLGGTVKPSGRKSEVTGRRIKSLLIPFRDSPLRRRSLASLHIPEDEVMGLGDVDTAAPSWPASSSASAAIRTATTRTSHRLVPWSSPLPSRPIRR